MGKAPARLDRVVMDKASAARLRRLVIARREELRRSRRRIHQMGGPTEPTLLKIERGQVTTLETATLRNLDVGLDWEPGSAAKVAAGGNPTPLRRRGSMAVGPTDVVVSAEIIGRVLTVAQEINDLAKSEAPAMQDAARRLDAAIQPLYSRYVTELLETNRRQNAALGPLVAMLGHLLDQPLDQCADDEREEALYRRWLAGIQVELDAATTTRFSERLKASR